MNLQNVTACVVALKPGDFYRSGRTLRALDASGVRAIDGSSFASAELSRRLDHVYGPLWIVRAGVWPRVPTRIAFPEQSQTGRPILALGSVCDADDSQTATASALAWRSIVEQSGGALEALLAAPDFYIPAESLFIAPELVARFRAELLAQNNIEAALQTLLRTTGVRCFRFSPLDVVQDERLRAAEVITSLQRGGAERVVLDLHATLPSRNVLGTLITTGRALRNAFTIPHGTVDVSGAEGGRARRMQAAALAARAMHADVVHAHLLGPTDLRAFREAALPVLVTVHNARPGWVENTGGLTRADADLLAACSQQVEADVVNARVDVPVRTAWNGIDIGAYASSPEVTARAKALRQTWGIPLGDAVLVALANPRKQKRLELLPEVLRCARKTISPRGVWLVIAGETSPQSVDAQDAEHALQTAIARSGEGSRIVRIPGAKDVAAVLHASDALVSVSAWEGLSLAHLEALAAELPVVATAAGGTAEIAVRAPGLKLVEVDAEPEEIAQSIAGTLATSDSKVPPSLQTDFCRYRMAERYAALLPRAITQFRRRENSNRDDPRGVWLVTNNFSTGGAQSSARRLLCELKRRGVTVRAAVVQEQISFPTGGRRELEAAGIPVLALTPSLPPNQPMGQADPLNAIAPLLEAIDREECSRPQTVVMWNLLQQYKVLLADLLIDVPVFDVSPGEMYFASLEKYFQRPRPGWPYRTAREYGARLAGVVVKYEAERTQAAEILGTPVHVIPNGVSISARQRVRDPLGRLVFGTAARLSPQKKLEELFEAFQLVHASLPPYVLKIAGGPEFGGEAYAEELRAKAAGLPVEWLGDVADVPGFLATLDVFVMISEPAGCPNASLEAMAAGLPVIATDVGGAGEQVVDCVTGRLVPRGDVRSFAAALVEAAENRACLERWGAAGRIRIETVFSLKTMADAYQSLITGVSNAHA